MKPFYLTHTFKTFDGTSRIATIAVVSIRLHTAKQLQVDKVEHFVDSYINDEETELLYNQPLQFGIIYGVSICCPSDEFNKEYGEKVAYNRALNSEPIMFSAVPFTPGMLEAIAQGRAKYVEEHPENFIKGYLEQKQKFINKINKDIITKAIPEDELKVIDKILSSKEYLEIFNNYAKMCQG